MKKKFEYTIRRMENILKSNGFVRVIDGRWANINRTDILFVKLKNHGNRFITVKFWCVCEPPLEYSILRNFILQEPTAFSLRLLSEYTFSRNVDSLKRFNEIIKSC